MWVNTTFVKVVSKWQAVNFEDSYFYIKWIKLTPYCIWFSIVVVVKQTSITVYCWRYQSLCYVLGPDYHNLIVVAQLRSWRSYQLFSARTDQHAPHSTRVTRHISWGCKANVPQLKGNYLDNHLCLGSQMNAMVNSDRGWFNLSCLWWI